MRTCGKCNTQKSDSEFYTKGSRHQSYCKPCFNKYCMQRWIDRKTKAVEYKGGRCEKCKNTYHYSVYDFHHIADKDAQWTKMRLWSWDRITKELDKCQLLCANCHRLEHYFN